MSTVLCFPSSSTTPIVFPIEYGFSDDAKEIRKEIQKAREHLNETNTFGNKISEMLENLFELRTNRSKEDWDGFGEKPINESSYVNAVRFALTLPPSLPVPEIYCDPDGIITFEWYKDKRRVFSVSIGTNGELSFAGLFGVNRITGIEHLTEYISSVILNNINRIYFGETCIDIEQ